MSTNLVIQSVEDQFLHWRQDMERKQEEQARQMKELRAHAEQLQRENDQLRAQMEKIHDLGNEVRDSVKLGIRSLAIKERNPSSVLMSIPHR